MTTLTVVPTTCPASNAVKFEKGSEFGLNEGGGGIGEVEGQGLGEKEGDGGKPEVENVTCKAIIPGSGDANLVCTSSPTSKINEKELLSRKTKGSPFKLYKKKS
jgi:hypothetical protein